MPLVRDTGQTGNKSASWPSNPFTQANLTKESNTASYDNAELIKVSSMVYHFAQQKSSKLLPFMSDYEHTNALIFQQDRFDKFEWKIRSKNIGKTPFSEHGNSKRQAFAIPFHAGWRIDRDQLHQTVYPLKPNVQMEMAYSLGRSIDEIIMATCYSSALSTKTVASASFQGIPVPTVTALPDSSIVGLFSKTTASGNDLSDWTSDAVDDLIEDFENDDHDLSDIVVVMTPKMRRQFKKIDDFRDRENTTSYTGNEDGSVIRWRGVTWVSMTNKIKIPEAFLATGKKFETGSKYAKASSSGTALSTISDNEANRELTVAFIPKCLQFKSMGAEGLYMSWDKRADEEDSMQLYARAQFGGLRVDDTGVRFICYNGK